MFGRARSLVGIETEYAVSVLGDDVSAREGAVKRIYHRALTRPHLAGIESGIFLSNGGRFYIDGGCHPEWASPEASNPWDGVRYATAGDRLLGQLADEVIRESPNMSGLVVRKGNVDYSSRTTWASHENYLHRCAPPALRSALVSHLISRIVFTGGGGFDPNGKTHPAFVLSPRALFIRALIAPSSMGALALVDERNQPHCKGFFRQHVMCADATESHLAMFLRLGTTAIVVAMIDAGCVVSDLVLANPLEALTIVAHDDTLQAPLLLASGGYTTALDLQGRYLERARAHLNRLPDWAGRVCDVWQDTLERLAQGPDAVADRLDWAIKRTLFLNRASRWGQHSGRVQAELYEIDLRFSQIHPPGLFQSLDEAGVLHHRVPGVDRIDEAMTAPPEDGRARIRGEVVTRLSGVNGVQCGWDSVRDSPSRRVLDLSSPFASDEDWHALPDDRPSGCPLVARMLRMATAPPSALVTGAIREAALRIVAGHEDPPVRRSGQQAIDLNNRAIEMRLAGRLEDAEYLMQAALAIDEAVPNLHKLPHRLNNLGVVLLLQGRTSEALDHVTQAWRLSGTRYDRTSVRTLVMRLAIAFLRHEPADLFIGQLKRHLAISPLPDFADVERRWRVTQMFESLEPLDADQRALLGAIAAVLNGERPQACLDDIARWRDAAEQPLDVLWPRRRSPDPADRRNPGGPLYGRMHAR
jgi:proteasome accessory factor A